MFTNARGFQIHGGTFNVNIADRGVNHGQHSADRDPLESLYQAASDIGASHNSEARYPPPQCHPGTRHQVLNVLHKWIHNPSPVDLIIWLYGPAGAGKSAIAQTISETGQKEGVLIASFFFSREDVKRNTARSLFLSIAFGLASSIPELQEPIREALRKNPTLLQASIEEQFQKLVVEPLNLIESSDNHPWLLVIDGLDECSGIPNQQRILSILSTALPKQLPLRFLVCSRPEPPIREKFNTENFRPYLRRVALDETFSPGHDIAIFLTSSFEQIRNSPRNEHIEFPVLWPARGVIDELVQKASGQFIYAATVVKFVNDEYSNPCTQLELVLSPSSHPDPESTSPFHDLDVLYHQILMSNPQRSKLREIIWALSLIPRLCEQFLLTPRYLEALLVLRQGDVITTLRGMHSILDIGTPKDPIRHYHASFDDFLHDERSGYFYVGDKQNQHSLFACWLLRVIDHYSRLCGGDEKTLPPEQWHVLWQALDSWGYHCSKSDLNEQVLQALRSVNFTKSFGFYVVQYLDASCMSHEFALAMRKIQKFFSLIEVLLQRLQTDPDTHIDIIQRFSDYRRGFRVKILRAAIPDAALLTCALDTVAVVSSSLLTNDTIFHTQGRGILPLQILKDTIPAISNFFRPEIFQIISLGNSCNCDSTRAKDSLTIPCSLGGGDVYHIQLSVAIRDSARIAMRTGGWRVNPRTLRITRSPISHPLLYHLCTLLDVCGPCPELLSLLGPFLRRIKSKIDRDSVLKWLQSFSSEYSSRTFPLIKQVKAITITIKEPP
ncbi:nwd2 [Moniliophthora roreri]|nr:nwd2 [Moniliophthora roreri]